MQGYAEQPRVLLVSVPYAMKAAEADRLAGHSASEFVTTDNLQTAVQQQLQQQTNGPSQVRTTAMGVSPNTGVSPYINNGTAVQVSANFNIDGNGTAATLNATSNYNLAGTPVLGNSGTQGMFVGAGAGQNNTGSYNLFLGIAAGHNTTAADYNTFIGTNAGYLNTTGTQNFMLGATAGYHNTTGSYNMFVGSLAGYSNTTGTRNAFVGRAAGYGNTTGTGNSFFGANAGSASTANFNTFLGGFSGTATTTGTQNTFVGWQAGQFNVTGSNNLILGYNAGSAGGTTSSNDVYLASPGAANETGVIRIGDPTSQTAAYMAGIYGNAPSGALPVVVNANGQLGTTTSGIGVTSFNGRSGAVVSAANDYSFSLLNGTLGSSQLSGPYSNAVTLSNTGNSFIGNGAGLTNVNAATLNGFGPGHFATNFGSPNYIQNNTVNPQNASFNITGTGNIGGQFSAQSGIQAFNSSQNNAAIIAQDNNLTGGSVGIDGETQNPAGIGIHGQEQATSGPGIGVLGESESTTGAGTVGVIDATTGRNFGVVGYTASTSGFGVVGTSPGVATAGLTQTCTALDVCTLTTGVAGQFATQTGGTLLQGMSGADLKSLATVFSLDSSGNLTAAGVPTNSVTGVAVYVDSSGHLGVQTSSARFKEQIRDMGDSTSALMKLRPVTFLYKPEYDKGPRTLQYGLIAEEVAQVYPDLVAYEPDGRPYTVKYQYLATMLLNELQKEHRQVEELKAELQVQNAELKKQNEELQQRLARVEMLLQSQMNTVVAQTASAVSLQPDGARK